MHLKIKAVNHSLQPMETHRLRGGAKQNLVISDGKRPPFKKGEGVRINTL